MTTATKQKPTTEKGNPRKDADAAYEAFMSMPESEWLGLIGSLFGCGVLEVEEQKGFERAMKTRGDAVKTKPTSNVVTTIPTGEQPQQSVVTMPPQSTGIVRYSITEADVAAIEAKRGLVVTDIKDKKQVDAVIQLHREAKKGRTTVDRERTEANKSLRAKIEDEINWNNNAAAALQSRLNPIEEEAAAELARVEAELEAERVAARTALLSGRKRLLAEVVGEYTDMLAIYPEDVLLGMGEAIFAPLLVTLGVQVEGRKQLAIQQAEQKAREEQAAKELAERERLAEVERLRLQAIEDAERKAAQEKLEAERAEFDRKRFELGELQRKADEERAARIAQEELDRQTREAERLAEQNAKLAAERAELESQRLAIEAERKQQETARLEQERKIREAEQAERDRVRQQAEHEAEMERIREQAEQEALAKKEADELAEIERQRVSAMRPDLEKLSEWIDRINESFTENLPVMSTEAGQELLVDLQAAMVESMEHWRGIVE